MKKTGIIESIALLKSLPNGIAAFSAWLPDTGRAKEFIRAWQQILALGDKFEETEADKRVIFKAVYGGTAKFKISSANALLRQLTKMIDEFSTIYSLKENGLWGMAEAELLFAKQKTKAAEKTIENTILSLQNSKRSDKLHTIAQMLFMHYFKLRTNKLDPKFQKILLTAEAAFDNYCLKVKLKTIAEKIIVCRIKGSPISDKTMKDEELVFNMIPKKTEPLISLQVKAIKFYLELSQKRYFAFKHAYVEQAMLLDVEQKHLLISLLNGIVHISPPPSNVMEEFYALFKFGFENGIFLKDNVLEVEVFTNFVFILRNLGKFKVLRELVGSHKHLVKNERERKSSVLMAECYLLMGEEKYFTAKKELANVKAILPVFYLRKYMAEIICTYEHAVYKHDVLVDINDLVQSLRRKLYKYRTNKKINQNFYKAIQNFIKFALTISNTRAAKNTEESLNKLLLSFEGIITEKTWILKIIAEHKNS